MRRLHYALLLCAVGGVACGDSTTPAELTITAADAALIMSEVGQAAVDGFANTFPGTGTPSSPAAAGTITLQAAHVHSCSGGGAINVGGFMSGSIDDASQAGRLDLQVDLTIFSCTVTGSGKEYTISATPLLSLSGDVQYRAGLPDGPQAFGLGGGFRWIDAEGRSGLCTIEFIVNWSTTESTINGGACGFAVEATF